MIIKAIVLPGCYLMCGNAFSGVLQPQFGEIKLLKRKQIQFTVTCSPALDLSTTKYSLDYHGYQQDYQDTQNSATTTHLHSN